VRTPLDVLRLYLRDGYRTAGQQRYYETDAAQRAGLRAWMELHDAKPAAAQQQ
jgi:hypothetical protein